MEFVPDERPSSAQQQQASKRKKGGKRKASGSEARPSKRRKKAPDAALLSATLNLLLGDNPQMDAWQKWAQGAATAAPPCQINDTDDDAEDDQDVDVADSEVFGLGQRRELPSGWRSVGGAAKMIKAAEVQIRQGASMQQFDEFLQELCERYEVDKSLSEAINPHCDESVHAMVKDMASMPPNSWAKYWSRMMSWEDWMCDPECQANGPDAYSPPPDARRDEDATGDIPDEPEPETDVQQAERVVQDQLSARFVTHQRFMRFIEAKERSGPRNPDAEARVELTDEMIRETGTYEDRTSGLWKQALVRRSMGYGFVSFRTLEAAENSIAAMHGKPIGYRHVRCGMAQHKQDTASLDYATVDMADPQNCNVYVGNISGNISDAGIEQLFSQIGHITDVKIHRKDAWLAPELWLSSNPTSPACTPAAATSQIVTLVYSKNCIRFARSGIALNTGLTFWFASRGGGGP
ncbi:hypothetical protein WJX82_005868 [Trebouxia sp. C0006]